jgi:hypothetical protein
LQAFDRAAKFSTSSLEREVARVKGDKLAIEAARMVEAVNRIGGASKLTDKELAHLNSTLAEVTEKAQRLGEKVPPAIAKMSAEIANLPKPTAAAVSGFSSLTSIVGKLGPLLPVATIAGAATALIRIGKSAFDSAGQIEDLASKTGLSTSAIQRMQFVANQTGTSVEAFTNATFKLGVNISEGLTKARKAVDDLGLSYTELKSQKPEEQFATVVKALEGMDNQQERNRIGVALFGRQFAEIAASIEEGYSDMADAAKVSSEEQIKALAKAGDEWQKFVDNAGAAVKSFLGDVVVRMREGLKPQDIREFTAAQREMLAEGIKNGENMISLMARVRGESRTTDIKLPGVSAEALASTRDYVQQLEAVRAKVKALDPETKRQLDAAIKLGEEQEKLSDRFDLTSEELRVYSQYVQEVEQRQKELAAKTKEAAKELAAFWKSVDQLNKNTLPAFTGLIGTVNTELGETEFFGKSITRSFDEQARAVGVLTSKYIPLKAAIEDTREGIADVTEKSSIFAGVLQDLGSAIVNALQGGGDVLKSIGGVIGKRLGENVAKNFGGAISGMFGDKLGGLINQILPGIGSLLGPLVGKIGGFFKKMFGPGIDLEELRKFNGEIQNIRDSLIQTHGSLEQIEKKANAVGLSFKNEWGHQGEKGLKQFNALIKEFETRIDGLNDGFSELFDELENAGEGLPDQFVPVIQRLLDMGVLSEDLAEQFKSLSEAPSFEQMSKAAEALGVRLESLGPAFDVKKLASDADSFLKNLRILERGGADIGGVLADAAGGINDLVNESIRLEAELPEGLRRFVEELAKSGKLVDANGEALTDLSQLNWAEPMSRSVDRLIDKFQELIDKIINQLGPAIEGIPGVPTGPSGGGNGSPDSIPFGGAQANGGDYVVSRPTMFLAGEAGPERATFTPLGGRGGDTSSIHIPISLDGRLVADVIVDRVGNRLSVRGAR